MKWSLIVGIAACALANEATAADPTTSERAWAKECVESLASDSDLVRGSAEAALSKLGADAMPTVLANIGRLKTDDHWAALERALAGMGSAGAGEALEKLSASWPKAVAARLDALVKRLRAAPSAAAAGGVAARVQAILRSFDGEMRYSSNEPRIQQIVGMGRVAVPTLLAELGKAGSDGPGFKDLACADAMRLLATDEDFAALEQLLRDGHLKAAKCFANLTSPGVVAALLAPITKGFFDHDLSDALARHRSDPRVPRAVLGWLQQYGPGGAFAVGVAATFLAECDEAAAVPLLLPLLESRFDAQVRLQAAKALVHFGEKQGVLALILLVEGGGDDFSGWTGHEAGEKLNDVVGERIYSGSAGPGTATGNRVEAAQRFRAWWESSKDRLRYDAKRHKWVVDPPGK